MVRYDLLIKPSAVKEIERIGRKKGCEKLAQHECYRVRQGWYRIIYAVDDQEKSVLVVKVGHRDC